MSIQQKNRVYFDFNDFNGFVQAAYIQMKKDASFAMQEIKETKYILFRRVKKSFIQDMKRDHYICFACPSIELQFPMFEMYFPFFVLYNLDVIDFLTDEEIREVEDKLGHRLPIL